MMQNEILMQTKINYSNKIYYAPCWRGFVIPCPRGYITMTY